MKFKSQFKKLSVILTAALIFAAITAAASSAYPKGDNRGRGGHGEPQRIVSLTPVGTEILYALGMGDRIIGVTEFCDWPPEALAKPKVGGFTRLNLEALVALKADLVVLQDLHGELPGQLRRLGIRVAVLRQENMEDVYSAIGKLGGVCRRGEKAGKLTAKIKKEIAQVAKAVEGKKKPRVLMSVSRELTDPTIRSFYAAGKETFYDELIRISGGVNACTETRVQYPTISTEGLSAINPDVIIELIGEQSFYHSDAKIDMDEVFDKENVKEKWLAVPGVKASRDGRVYIFDGTKFLRPGPRIGEIARAFAAALHPEVKF